MSYVEEIMKENAGAQAGAPEETQEQPNDTPQETPQENPQEQPQETPEETKGTDEPPAVEKPQEQQEPPQEQPSEDKPAEQQQQQQKPDLSKLTKEQKAEHAFQRQLAKQKAKYESSIEDIKKTFQSQFEDIKKQLDANKPKEQPKTRADFETDDEYIDYLTEEKVKAIMADRDAQAAEAASKKEKEDKEAQEEQERRTDAANHFNMNARAHFKDENAYVAFTGKVKKSLDNGLGEVLDEAPAVRDFIFTSPDGPMLLNEILDSKESFMRVMTRAGNPTEATIACYELAREIANRKPAEQQQQPVSRMPNIGKPGAGAAPSTAPDMWHDDASLIDFVRKHR